MPTLYLVRHGETDWNRSGQIMGSRPVPLNENGRSQARELAQRLGTLPIEKLYSSPVDRARQTADIVASALHIPVTIDNGLTEIGVGEWEGKFWDELVDDIARINFYASPHDARPPGGETLREVQSRAVAAVQRACLSEESGPVVLVSHADIVRAILGHYLRIDLELVRQMRIDHASLSALDLNGTLADLLFLNYTPQSISP